MNLLLNLSLHGSLAFLLVWALDRAFAGKMSTMGRGWWWTLVPAAFLLSIPFKIHLKPGGLLIVREMSVWAPAAEAGGAPRTFAHPLAMHIALLCVWLWIAGAVLYLLVVMIQTRTALLLWSRERLSTDPAILGLLEDCKQEAGITAPIGLVVSDRIHAPAILGWLRPRILVPRQLVSSLARQEMRVVLFHELAHFRSLDIPRNWVFTVVRAIHWFNPFAHLAFHAWARFREEAADESAMLWLKESSGDAYGHALLHIIKQANGFTPPFGALAIGESIHTLKRRIIMINRYPNKSPRLLLAGTVFTLAAAGFLVRPIRADDATAPGSSSGPATIVSASGSVTSGSATITNRSGSYSSSGQATVNFVPDTDNGGTFIIHPTPGDDSSQSTAPALTAMQTWLREIDHDQYAQSWTDASDSFQKAVTSDQWTAALNSVRTPLGKCSGRSVASALHQMEVPGPTGPIKGDFVVAQFNTSFANLAYAVETVCFEKAADGTWKASGYYIKPRS